MNRTNRLLLLLILALAGGIGILLSSWGKGGYGIVPPCFRLGPPEHHRYEPNCAGPFRVAADRSVQYKFNELGLRERPLARLPDEKRILFLGDSNVEGHGLEFEQSLSQRVESKLGLPTVNAGIRFSGPVFQLRRLEKLLPLVRPAQVVWALCENDWSDDRLFEALSSKRDAEGMPEQFSTEDFRLGSSPWLQPRGVSWLDPAIGVFRYRYYQRAVESLSAGVKEQDVRSCAAIARGAELLRKKGTRLLFVLFPLGPNNPSPGLAREFERVASCLPKDAEVLDFRERLKGAEWYLPGDTHPNTAGVELVADEIARRLGPKP